MPVIPTPMKIARGKARAGFLVSSAMLTESSKPTNAKKPSAVAPSTPVSRAYPVPPVSIWVSREGSPSPLNTAYAPIARITASPLTSTRVRTTFAFTDSATPRRLIAARARTNRIAIRVGGTASVNSPR